MEQDHLHSMVMPVLEDAIAEKRRYHEEGKKVLSDLKDIAETVPWFVLPHIWWMHARVWWYWNKNRRRLIHALKLEEGVRERMRRMNP